MSCGVDHADALLSSNANIRMKKGRRCVTSRRPERDFAGVAPSEAKNSAILLLFASVRKCVLGATTVYFNSGEDKCRMSRSTGQASLAPSTAIT